MNPEIKSRWIAALRSGDYVQTTGRLRRGTDTGPQFCCLGVLCELAVQADVVRVTDDGTDRYTDPDDDMPRKTSLPLAVLRWAGITNRMPHVTLNGTSLVQLNDVERLSFDGIADVIEEYL